MIKPIEWRDDKALILDQTRLPLKEIYVECHDFRSIAKAIKSMMIRGAPAIGIAACIAIALESKKTKAQNFSQLLKEVERISEYLRKTRPTAKNLFWAIERMREVLMANKDLPIEEIKRSLIEEAKDILKKDIDNNRKMGAYGRELIRDGDKILTHCNAGALATGGYGTALGVVRAAFEEGKNIKVIASETRPLLQGARLTCWELKRDGIPVRLITDNMAGSIMKRGEINLVIVGADRIAANGDVVNKIGTYSVAVLAHHHQIPFYVAAPTNTVDMTLSKGEEIPIEERKAREITHIGRKRIAPENLDIKNPAFDLTPHSLISAIITERGIVRPPYKKTLKAIMEDRKRTE